MRIALAVAAIVIAFPGAMAALHLGLLAIASLFYRPPRKSEAAPRRWSYLALVPAHNEEAVIAATLAALVREMGAADRLLVVADRCTDLTADIARDYGCLVLERPADAPPGRAPTRQDGLDHAARMSPWDFLVMVDADCVVEEGFLDALDAALQDGVEVAQARTEASPGRGVLANAFVAAYAVQGVLLARGRHSLGLPVRVRGTGVAVSRRLALQHRFRAPAGEDRWFGLDLCLEGVAPRHVDGARLRAESVGNWRHAAGQRVRYEAGRMSAARAYVPRLLRCRTPACWEAVWELLTPPLALAALSLATGLAIAMVAGNTEIVLVLVVLLAFLCSVVVLALVEARADWRTWLSLAAAPWYLLWKVMVQLRAIASVRRRQEYFPPTPRS